MDSPTADHSYHSDSDSGESWTLLENSPAYGDTAPQLPENATIPFESENVGHSEKDEDTDGISIISDSDPESSPCDHDVKLPLEETAVAGQQNASILTSPLLPAKNNDNEKVETDFLGDNVKFKTYVHKRNPKVGTILDIIMLGTFIITAGMALGHLWSCKNECTTQTSVNKILSNLYKLQEENAYLRNKLKEISQVTSYQLGHQKKLVTNKLGNKQNRCKKIFEEPIMNDNKGQTVVKCVDEVQPGLAQQDFAGMPEYEKEFLNDVNKMKNIYNRNKKWLDAEVKKQFDATANSKSHDAKPEIDKTIKSRQYVNVEQQLGPNYYSSKTDDANSELKYEKKIDPILKLSKLQEPKTKTDKPPKLFVDLEQHLRPTHFKVPLDFELKEMLSAETEPTKDAKPHRQLNIELQLAHAEKIRSGLSDNSFEIVPEKKITYADSLKIDQPLQKRLKSESIEKPDKLIKEYSGKKKHSDDEIMLILNSFSEDDIKKDDRYTGPKMKHEKKKHDRQKSHKKQKRQNKYEQWEMKGGYLKDFDEFSITSSLDNDINKQEKRFLNPNFENYVNKLMKTEPNSSNKDLPKKTMKNEKSSKVEKRSMKYEKGKKGKGKDADWYDQRSALRAEARLKLEQELFEENTSNNAAWYFRRVQKREQCRTQNDNSTFKKFSKRKMNFKMKR